eukprot:3155416-Amphidinium_carterae.1
MGANVACQRKPPARTSTRAQNQSPLMLGVCLMHGCRGERGRGAGSASAEAIKQASETKKSLVRRLAGKQQRQA